MLYFGGNLGLVHFRPESVLPKISERPCGGWCSGSSKSTASPSTPPTTESHATARRHRTDRPRPQATQPRHQLRGAGIPSPPRKSATPAGFTAAASTKSGTTSKNRTSANYSHLPAGRYVFELTAQNPDGFWNSEPRRLEIVIKPSPLLTWYAFCSTSWRAGTAAWFANRLFLRRRLQNRVGGHRKELEREEGAHEHEDQQFLHQHLARAADAPDADLRPVNMLPGIQDQKPPARTGQPDQRQHPTPAQTRRSDAQPEPHRERHAAAFGLPAGHPSRGQAHDGRLRLLPTRSGSTSA